MKLRNVLFLFLLALCAALSFAPAGIIGSLLLLMVVGALLSRQTPQGHLMATISATEILQDTLDALKVMVPFMHTAFSTDFQATAARKGDSIIMHIAGLPSVQSYDATSGYEANATEASAMITDVTVALNQHSHVPTKVDYIDQLSSRKDLYAVAIRNMAYVLGKQISDYALGLCTATNVTHGTAQPAAGVSHQSLEAIRTALNTQGAAPVGRFGIISPAYAAALSDDPRCTSRDYYGQIQAGPNAYRQFRGMAGFENIWEYPDLASTSAGNATLNGIFGDKRLVGIATRLPVIQDAGSLGIPNIAAWETVTDPDTGLALTLIRWQKQGTFDLWQTVTCLYGAAVGTAGGAANAIVDKAGYRVTES